MADRQQTFIPLADLPPPFEPTDRQRGWAMDGADHGLEAASVLVMEIAPGAGPPLHRHASEEVQVLPDDARVKYAVGEERFTAEGPGVVCIPAGLPHALAGAGDAPARVTAFFPDVHHGAHSETLGPNPFSDTWSVSNDVFLN